MTTASLPIKDARTEFQEWYAQEQARGLVDIKFYPGDTSEASVDSFFAEINAMNLAKAQGKAVPLKNI